LYEPNIDIPTFKEMSPAPGTTIGWLKLRPPHCREWKEV